MVYKSDVHVYGNNLTSTQITSNEMNSTFESIYEEPQVLDLTFC